MLWPETLCGAALAVLFASASWCALLLAMPFLASLLLAIPFCVLTASPGFSAWLRARGIAATPEEIAAR
jgi:membrane glycosyltransferase